MDLEPKFAEAKYTNDPKRLRELAKESADVQIAVVGNPYTPDDVLDAFIENSEDYNLLKRIAQRSLSKHQFYTLYEREYPEINIMLAKNRSITLYQMRLLSKDPTDKVRIELAKNRRLSHLFHLQLIEDIEDVRIALAMYQKLQMNIMMKLYRVGSQKVRAALLQNRRTREYYLQKESEIIRRMTSITDIIEAYDIHTPQHRLAELALHPSKKVREMVMINSATHDEVVEMLFESEEGLSIDKQGKGKLTDKMAHKIINTGTESDKIILARHMKMSESIATRLSQTQSIEVLKNMAINNNMHPSILSKLSKHQEISILIYVARNENTPSNALDFLGLNSNQAILVAVVKNPNTSTMTLNKILEKIEEKESMEFMEIKGMIKERLFLESQ